MSDTLGQSKNLGQDSGNRPKDLVYGKPSAARSKNGQVVAADVIRGLLLWLLDITLYIYFTYIALCKYSIITF
jgi:hypothetical protein